MTIDKFKYPDLTIDSLARDCYSREQFRYRTRVFKRTGPGQYSDGTILVYCDQQYTTSWKARVGGLVTERYWFPEYAVNDLVGNTYFPNHVKHPSELSSDCPPLTSNGRTEELTDSEYQRIQDGYPTMGDCRKTMIGMSGRIDVEVEARFSRGEPTMADCRAMIKARQSQAMDSLESRRQEPHATATHAQGKDPQHHPVESWFDYSERRLNEDVATASEPSIFHLRMFRDLYRK